MKTLLVSILSLCAVTLARADFTSYTLVSQSDPLTYDPVVTFTYDSLSINMTGNTPTGLENLATDQSSSATENATIVLSFTDTASIVGHSVVLEWFFPNAATLFESFPSVPVPGSVFAGSGAGTFTITGNTVTIVNTTSGWSAADFNGFVILDLTRQQQGPPNPISSAPDAGSTLLLVGAGLAGLALFRRRAVLA
jgi:hypothetical protein